MSSVPTTVDDYIDGFPPAIQAVLRTVRDTARQAAPQAEERLSYRMPSLFQGGVVVHYGAFKRHLGLFPPVEDPALRARAASFAGPKGNLQFPYGQPMPLDLISAVVQARVRANATKAVAKRPASSVVPEDGRLRASCHCGAVSVSIPAPPQRVTNCNCSICRRYGTLWGYFDQPDVLIEAAAGAMQEYAWGARSIAFVRCAACGCVTHWRPLAGRKSLRMGVNIRNFEPAQIGPVRIRLLDGADTDEFVGEHGPIQSRATTRG